MSVRMRPRSNCPDMPVMVGGALQNAAMRDLQSQSLR